MTGTDELKLTHAVKRLITLFIIGLVLSGLTAFPIEWQLSVGKQFMDRYFTHGSLTRWIDTVYEGVRQTNSRYPFIFYGTDWLAFSHLVIAIAFIGPLRDPVKNIWVIQFGMIACVSVFPLAFIAGAVRGIPIYWQLIDCSFGIGGGLFLWMCYSRIKHLEKLQNESRR